jgi:uncharacterized membrane protein YccC
MRSEGNWTVLWKTVTRVETGKIIPWIALRNTIGVACPLIAGLLYGQVSAGLVMGTGALNVSFSDGKDPYQQRARRMLLASLFCGLAVVVGSATGRDPIAATLIAAWWAFAAGMMVALGTTAADIGTVSLVVLVVFAAQPMAPDRAALSGLLALAGGLFQTSLSVASWLRRPHEPERRALGQLYAGLKQMIEVHVDASLSPPATPQSNEAGNALATLSDYSLESERYRSLLNQAERARMSILAIKRLRARMRRESVPDCPEVLDRVLAVAAQVCDEVGRLLMREVVSIHAGGELDLLQALVKSIPEGETPVGRAMNDDARFQVAALAGQLRAAVSLASHAVGAGQRAFERQEAKKPWTLRLTSSLAKLRANLTLRSTAFRHALRLACCIAIGVSLSRGMGLTRPYWIPMTIAIVLKPDFSSTFSRGVLRLAGTYVGLLAATGLFHMVSPSVAVQIVLVAAFTFLCRCFGPANYGILTTAVSALVVLLIALTGVSPKEVIAARALNTTIGGLLALAAYAAWPTWERTQLPGAMAKLLDAYRKYLHAVARAYSGAEGGEGDLAARRLEGRLARSNMEASVERYRAEPGASAEELSRLMSMLASSHRFAHAAISLEADLAADPSRAVPEGVRPFFEEVDRTLGLLTATLGGLRPTELEFPDLREAHMQLLQSGSEFALLNTETDRITNSLNTLREQIVTWMAGERRAISAEPNQRAAALT